MDIYAHYILERRIVNGWKFSVPPSGYLKSAAPERCSHHSGAVYLVCRNGL